jgi:hypothetical protein
MSPADIINNNFLYHTKNIESYNQHQMRESRTSKQAQMHVFVLRAAPCAQSHTLRSASS